MNTRPLIVPLVAAALLTSAAQTRTNRPSSPSGTAPAAGSSTPAPAAAPATAPASAPAAAPAPGSAPAPSSAPASGTAPAGAQADSAAPPAEGQQAPKPAAEATPPPPPPPPQKVGPEVFDKALADYFAGNPRASAGPLYAWLSTTARTDENYAWGQYFLARSLVDLELTHAGAWYLARIARERSNPNTLPRALESLRDLTDKPHDEVMIDEQVFGALDLGFLTEDAGAYAHYQQGLVDLRVGSERWATTHFSKLPEGSVEASRARYAMLVTRLRQVKDPSEELIAEFLTVARDEKLSREARNEAALAVARLRYEREDYKGALEAYSLVVLPQLDPGRASLYLEEAWTRYKLGDLRAALGILTTLDAPSFRDEFVPDKYLLRALIYRDLCHYLPAKRAAKDLLRRYRDSLEAVRNRDDLTQDPRLRRAANARGSTRRAARFLSRLEYEAAQLSRYTTSFGERLHAHLFRLYSLAIAEARRTYQARLEEAVRQEADTLLRATEQVRLMDYEVGLKLYERVRKSSRPPVAAQEEVVGPTQVAFPFDNEYWNDELRSYRVRIDSRCLEENP